MAQGADYPSIHYLMIRQAMDTRYSLVLLNILAVDDQNSECDTPYKALEHKVKTIWVHAADEN